MGETEGKKDEADYKRLQTFPLVRVRPGRLGWQGGQVPIVSLCSGPRSVLQTSEPRPDLWGSTWLWLPSLCLQLCALDSPSALGHA